MKNDAHKIKIVRVISRLNVGGPAIHTILLSSDLNRDGYKDILVCGEPSESEGNMRNFAREQNVEALVIPSLQRDISFARDMKAFLQLYSILKREKPDIIHTHTAKAGALGRLAALLAGVPIKVHTFHGHVFDGYFSPLRAKIFILIERFLALFTDKIVTVSESVRDEIVDKLKITTRPKSVVVPLGLDLDKYLHCEDRKGSFRRKLGLDQNTLLVGIIGRLVPIKNHKMFMDIARIVIEKNPGLKIKFLVIGDGELKKSLKDYSLKSGLGGHIIFTGWIEDLAGVYVDLDIFALTSLNEGTPVSLIEAMASAKAVIATNVGGVKDLISDGITGMLIKPSDMNDFYTKLVILLKDEKIRKELGLNARKSVAVKYTKDRLVTDIKRLYEELLEKNFRTNA